MGMMNRGGVEAVVLNYFRAIDRSEAQFDFKCLEYRFYSIYRIAPQNKQDF